MVDSTIQITLHGEERIRERLGIPKRAVKTLALKAWLFGYTQHEVTGDLKRHLSIMSHTKEEGKVILYGQWIFLFDNTKLVTVVPLPKALHMAAAKLQKREKPNGEL